MSLTLSPVLSPRMTEALVAVAAAEKFGTGSYLDNFRNATVLGLESRDYIQMNTEKGYVLTITGQCYLVEKSLGIWGDHNELLLVQTTYISGEKRQEVLRDYHLQKAMKKFNSVHNELTEVPFIEVVEDSLNNVNRRCNVRGNDDTETRCWEILARFNFVDNPTENAMYIVRYVGTEWTTFYTPGGLSPYYMVNGDDMSNLY